MNEFVLPRVAIVGARGIPASYGGFETQAENLVKYHASDPLPDELTVYCSGRSCPVKLPIYHSALLKYVPLHASGAHGDS